MKSKYIIISGHNKESFINVLDKAEADGYVLASSMSVENGCYHCLMVLVEA